MISYEEFVSTVCDRLRTRYPERKVDLHRILKPDHPALDGVTVLQEGKRMSPMVYLNDLYRDLLSGTEMDLIMEDIDSFIDDSACELEMDVSALKDPDFIRDKILFKLINYDNNVRMLSEMPHRRFLDLAVVYYFVLKDANIGTATSLVFRSHTDLWGLSEEELFSLASRNTPRLLGCGIKNMDVMVRELLLSEMKGSFRGTEEYEAFKKLQPKEQALTNPMFVMTNREGYQGASCVLDQEKVGSFADMVEDDLYVLPSSIHEVILLPRKLAPEAAELERMVKSINRTELDPADRLSDHIYLYRRRSREIFLFC